MTLKQNKKSHNKIYNIFYKKFLAICFILFIFIILIVNFLSKDNLFSYKENRILNTKPKFSLYALLNNNLTQKYEDYISDQFLCRDFFISIKSSLEKILGKKEFNNVYLCRDKYLIYKFQKPNKEDIGEKIKYINNFVEENKNINNHIMIVPSKIKILEDKLPKFTPYYDQVKYINNFYSSLSKNIKTIDLFPILNKNKDNYIYYRTDHHWTTKAAYYAYLEFCKSAKITPKFEDDYSIKIVSNNFYGTLYSRAGIKNIPPDKIYLYLPKKEDTLIINYIEEKKKSTSLYNSERLKTTDKYSIFTDGNHPIMKIKTTTNNNKKLLIIKDSYANSFIPFLTSNYNEILVVDLRYYANNIKNLIKDNNITDTLILYSANTFFEDDSILNIF